MHDVTTLTFEVQQLVGRPQFSVSKFRDGFSSSASVTFVLSSHCIRLGRNHQGTVPATTPLLPKTIMKTLFVLSLATGVAAFAPQPAALRTKTTSLYSSIAPKMPKEDWSGKPLPKPESTTPQAVKDVNWLQKQTLPNVMIEPDYYLTAAMGLLGPLIMWYHPGKTNVTIMRTVLRANTQIHALS